MRSAVVRPPRDGAMPWPQSCQWLLANRVVVNLLC
ncbi:hypothetical protein MLPM_0776 [Mycobacterium lepromatosis]|uniref:Uncharacterized protein n=1 Tax=Mycobacterium lepromatosis TaxID=480418 RepID=A0A0F4ERG2_9MYCO|nr:hypothetical protein MLPM_0776 [Mycobacterium lepromatosis]